MPIYDYICSSCDHRFEKQELIKNRLKPEKKPCPECGKTSISQYLPSSPGVHSGGIYKKTDGGFNEVLSKVAQHHPHHTFGHLLDRN